MLQPRWPFCCSCTCSAGSHHRTFVLAIPLAWKVPPSGLLSLSSSLLISHLIGEDFSLNSLSKVAPLSQSIALLGFLCLLSLETGLMLLKIPSFWDRNLKFPTMPTLFYVFFWDLEHLIFKIKPNKLIHFIFFPSADASVTF